MITIEDLKNPQTFSDFVERMEKGETTEEEEAVFSSYLDMMEKTVAEMKEIITNNQETSMQESHEKVEGELSPDQLLDQEIQASDKLAALNRDALWAESLNTHPAELSQEVLEKLEERLSSSLSMHVGEIGKSLKYAIPLAPFARVAKGKEDKALDTVLGATLMNMPVGVGMAFAETIELVSKYRKMLSVRREMRARQSIEHALQ